MCSVLAETHGNIKFIKNELNSLLGYSNSISTSAHIHRWRDKQ